jgi:hypothetical protein
MNQGRVKKDTDICRSTLTAPQALSKPGHQKHSQPLQALSWPPLALTLPLPLPELYPLIDPTSTLLQALFRPLPALYGINKHSHGLYQHFLKALLNAVRVFIQAVKMLVEVVKVLIKAYRSKVNES